MGEIKEFTGISSPYEEPENPEVVIDTGSAPLDDCVNKVIAYLIERGVLREDKAVAGGNG
jgi:adenylylsulfate kinase